MTIIRGAGIKNKFYFLLDKIDLFHQKVPYHKNWGIQVKVMGGGDEIQFFYEGFPKPSKSYREVPQMDTTQKGRFISIIFLISYLLMIKFISFVRSSLHTHAP